MTAFSFMASAAQILVGAICLSVALLILCAAGVSIYKQIKGARDGGK